MSLVIAIGPNLYLEMMTRLDNQSAFRRNDILRLRMSAISYAMGRQDGEGTGNVEEQQNFELLFWEHALKHYETGSALMSVRDAFESMREHGAIRRS